MLQQRGEGMGQHLVRAIADEHLFGPHLMVGRQSRKQRGTLRIRIEAQRIGRLAADCFQREGGRTKRAFIGVQLNQVRHVGLLAWDVGNQAVRRAAPETTHSSVQMSSMPRRGVRIDGRSIPERTSLLRRSWSANGVDRRLPSSGSRRAREAAPHGECGPARLGLWAEISKQARRHCLHIIAPPSVELSKCALLARLADGERRSVFRDGEFDLKPASAVGDDDRRDSIAQRQQKRLGFVRCQVEMGHHLRGIIARRLASDRDGHARPVDGRYLGNASEREGAIATAANFDRSWPPRGQQWGHYPGRGWWERNRQGFSRAARKSGLSHNQCT
jgi:hypothetical protein